MKKEIRYIELERLSKNPNQPREEFSDKTLHALAQSIRSVGLLQPPVVRLVDQDRYEIIAGERRCRAAKLAGLQSIPVLIEQGKEAFSAEAALIENIQREDLSPIEVAISLKRLMEDFSYTQEKLSKRIGMERSTLANHLRLLQLPIPIQAALKEKTLTMGHAKALLSADTKDQLPLFKTIQEENLSVRDTERRIQCQRKTEKKPQSLEALHLEAMAMELSEILSTKVSLSSQGEKGTVSIHFTSFDELDALFERLKDTV